MRDRIFELEKPEIIVKELRNYFFATHYLDYREYEIRQVDESSLEQIKKKYARFDEEKLVEVFVEALERSTYPDSNRKMSSRIVQDVCIGLLNLQDGDNFLDLGSGDGLLIYRALSGRKTLNNVYGVELDREKYENSIIIKNEFADHKNNFKHLYIENTDFNFFIDERNRIVYEPLKVVAYPDLFKQSISNYNYLQRTEDCTMFIKNCLKMIDYNHDTKAVVVVPDTFLYSSKFEGIRDHLISLGYINKIIEIDRGFYDMDTPFAILELSYNNTHIKSINLTKEMDFSSVHHVISHLLDDYNYLNINSNITHKLDNLTYSNIKNLEFRTNHLIKDKFNNLSDLAEIILGSQKTEKQLNLTEYGSCLKTLKKVVRPIDIDEDGLLNVDTLLKTEQYPNNYDKFARNGDIIITTKSSNIRLAIVKGLREHEDLFVSGGMFIIRCKEEFLNPYWLKMYLSSDFGKQLLDAALTGDKIKVMTKESISNLNILEVPIGEQIESSKDYKECLELLSHTKQRVIKGQKELARLSNNEFKVFNKDLDFDKQEIVNFDITWPLEEERFVAYFLSCHQEDYEDYIDDFMVIYEAASFQHNKGEILEKCNLYKKAEYRKEVPLIMNVAYEFYQSMLEDNSSYELPINEEILDEGKILAKNYIRSLLRACGYLKDEELTIVSENKTLLNVYWATPSKNFLTSDWLLALNDYRNHKLHILKIPAFDSGLDFKSRKDDETRLHIEVLLEDDKYLERKSGSDLTKYLFKVFNY